MAKKKKSDDERCESCEEAVAIGEYIRVCDTSGNKKECKILFNKISSEEISPKKFYKEVRKLVKDKPKLLHALDEIDEILEEIRNEED